MGGPAFESWNVGYALPAGWQISQQVGRVHVLAQVDGAQGASISVAPGMYQNFNEAAVDLNKGFMALGLTGTPMGQPAAGTIGGMQAMTADYVGQMQTGLQLQARVAAVLTPHGTGLVVLGVATPQLMSQVRTVVDELAQSIRVTGLPQPNAQAVGALRGRWMYYAGRADGSTSVTGAASRSHEEFVEFDGQGRFVYQSSSSVNVITPGYTGSAGGAQASNDDGSYTVIGSTLVLRGRQGQMSFELQILADRVIADGRTYLRAN